MEITNPKIYIMGIIYLEVVLKLQFQGSNSHSTLRFLVLSILQFANGSQLHCITESLGELLKNTNIWTLIPVILI